MAWIHPFEDGNGRVLRLWSDAVLRALNLKSYGLWCLSRGLARTDQYKALLASADRTRQGDRDGRGALSEAGLMAFCELMLNTSLDQVNDLSQLMDLKHFYKRLEGYVAARNQGMVPGYGASLPAQAAVVLHHAFLHGELNRATALALTGMPERSARRLFKQLRDEGFLSETSHKSPLKWEIPEHVEPWYFPQLTPQV